MAIGPVPQSRKKHVGHLRAMTRRSCFQVWCSHASKRTVLSQVFILPQYFKYAKVRHPSGVLDWRRVACSAGEALPPAPCGARVFHVLVVWSARRAPTPLRVCNPKKVRASPVCSMVQSNDWARLGRLRAHMPLQEAESASFHSFTLTLCSASPPSYIVMDKALVGYTLPLSTILSAAETQ